MLKSNMPVLERSLVIEECNEKVSVIIPTYNRQDKLLKSINSVLEQTYSNIELIIVDDASTDNTRELVESIKDDRVRYICLSQNMGAAGARNEGVKAATSNVIAFHDSDDVWRPDKLEKQMDYLKKNPEYVMVYCAYQYHKEDMTLRMPPEKCEGTEGCIFPWLLIRNTIGTPTVVMKKDVFMELGGFNSNLRCLEDWEFAVRLSEKHSIGYVDEILMDAHFSGGSVSSQTAHYFETRCYMIAEFKQQLTEYKLFDVVVKDLFNKAVKMNVLNEVKDMLGHFLKTM